MAGKVGFVGLGNMGGPMALNLVKAGFELLVHDIDPADAVHLRDVREHHGTLGAHTDSILAELGYSAADIEALKSQKVVLRSDRMLNIDDPE